MIYETHTQKMPCVVYLVQHTTQEGNFHAPPELIIIVVYTWASYMFSLMFVRKAEKVNTILQQRNVLHMLKHFYIYIS